ncbi:MAG: class I SAM-dependent methyltransferase [bacterium]|nr:class I SAM-dependent methyltransferase [bacterium]
MSWIVGRRSRHGSANGGSGRPPGPPDTGTTDAPDLIYVPFEKKPHDLFRLHLRDGRRVVGLKTAHQAHNRGDDLTPRKGCLVDESMILGVDPREQLSEDGVTVYYRPVSAAQRRALFDAAVADAMTDLHFPYPHLDRRTRRERRPAPEYWTATPARVDELDGDEEVLRRYALGRLRSLDPNGKMVFDPACSTGRFLAEVKRTFPAARTVGQDLSASMADHASRQVDEIHVGDAARPAIPAASADIVVIRFLNLDVVSTADAHRLLDACLSACRPGGWLILFGHTPVLVSAEWLAMLGLRVVQRTGHLADHRAMFQFYVAQVPEDRAQRDRSATSIAFGGRHRAVPS